LIEKHTVDELVSVLAHEIGHYKMKHIHRRMLVSFLLLGLNFFLLSFLIKNPGLFEAFKTENLSTYCSFVFFGILYTPLSILFGILTSYLSRKHEFEADRYSARTGNDKESMISALKKLSTDALSNLTPHPLKVILGYSHPPILERIRAIRNYTVRSRDTLS